ncbi:MAG TPA: YihY family inner membrane protein [Burkholderiaceae bacterium]
MTPTPASRHLTLLNGLSWPQARALLQFALRRLREERLPQVAGGLTFTTVLALVPVLTIAFALFTTFPIFTSFRASLEAYFIQSLMPKAIANNILGYLTTFASKATRLSAVGAVVLIITTITTMSMVERVSNQIWRARAARPFAQRILVYWALVTLGPLLIGVSLSLSSHLFTATGGIVRNVPLIGGAFLTLTSIGLTAIAFALLYTIVPNRFVAWRDALWGGLLAAIAFEIAKRLFAIFIAKFSTYTVIYGALAALPVFLLWVYLSWLITLFGAVLVAALPVVKYERWWHVPAPGSSFIDAMAVLAVLVDKRERAASGAVGTPAIRHATRMGYDEIDELLEKMLDAGWVGRVKGSAPLRVQWGKRITEGADSWILLANPAQLTVADVYRLFVFNVAHGATVASGTVEQTGGAAALLALHVESVLDAGLAQPVGAYFAAHTIAETD